MMAELPISVFISYSRTDSAFVDRLEADLRGYGFRTWVDRQHLEGGADWARLIEEQILKCDVLVVSVSPDAVASQWVQNEIVYAQSASKRIIPVVVRPVERVPIEIIRLQFIDLGSDYANRLQELRVTLLKVSSLPMLPRPTQAPQSLLALPDVTDPLKGLVQIPPAQPTPNQDLMAVLRQAQSALAHGELDLAEALLQQIVTRESEFGNGLAAEELRHVRTQLAPIQLERLRNMANQAHTQGAWGQEIGALRALTDRLPDDAELRDRLALAEDCERWSFLYSTAREFAQSGDRSATLRTLAQLWAKAPYFGDPGHIAPQGLQTAIGTQSLRELRIRTMPQGQLITELNGHSGKVSILRWSPTGRMLATAGETRNGPAVRIWEDSHWDMCSTMSCDKPIYGLEWSPEGTKLACAAGDESESGLVWHVPDGTVTNWFDTGKHPIHIHWSPDGRGLIAIDSQGRLLETDLRHSDMNTRSSIQMDDAFVRDKWFVYDRAKSYTVTSVLWSPDGKYVAFLVGVGEPQANPGAYPRLLHCVLDVNFADPIDAMGIATPRRLGGLTAPVRRAIGAMSRSAHYDFPRPHTVMFRGSALSVTCTAWDPQSSKLAIGTPKNEFVIADLDKPSIQLTVRLSCSGHSGSISAIGWSPDGSRIASASNDVRLWDSSDGHLLLTYSGHKARVTSLAWSPDGTCIASGDDSGIVHIWRA